MSNPTFDLLILTLCVLPPLLLALVGLYRLIDQAAYGRDLLKAAGSRCEARLAIESVRLERALARKFGEAFVRQTLGARSQTFATGLPHNVTRLVPRIVSGGREVNFTPNGDAA